MCAFTGISDKCMTAALLVSESEVLIFWECRLQPCFRNSEQVGAAQPCCHVVSCQFPHYTESLLTLQGGEERMLVPAAHSECVMPVVEKETGSLV